MRAAYREERKAKLNKNTTYQAIDDIDAVLTSVFVPFRRRTSFVFPHTINRARLCLRSCSLVFVFLFLLCPCFLICTSLIPPVIACSAIYIKWFTTSFPRTPSQMLRTNATIILRSDFSTMYTCASQERGRVLNNHDEVCRNTMFYREKKGAEIQERDQFRCKTKIKLKPTICSR